jgi:hypothetical protein
MSMVMTHLTEVADRIDRSNSPCGGREERELYKLFKDLRRKAAQHSPREIELCWITYRDGVLLQPCHLSLVPDHDAIFCAK